MRWTTDGGGGVRSGRAYGVHIRWAVLALGGALIVTVMLAFAISPTAAVDGPTPPQLGDRVGTNLSPHGGYSPSSNMCLQCHDVHDAAGEYSLMWKNSVTYMCATCHGLHGLRTAGLGLPMTCSECHSMHGGSTMPVPRDPIGSGAIGTVSSRGAYDLSQSQANGAHVIGALSPPGESGIVMTESDWLFSWGSSGPPPVDATTASGAGSASDTAGGLYCGSCHTPHGEYGQLVNNWDPVADEGMVIWWSDPTSGLQSEKTLHFDSGTGAWQVCDPGPTNCAWAQVQDAEQQLVSLYGYKVLAEFPNHTYSTSQSYHTEQYNDDGARWCGSCHPSRIDGSTFHNHDTGCGACHGNPASGSSSDFPHTSSADSLLRAYPDALCLTCHTVMP